MTMLAAVTQVRTHHVSATRALRGWPTRPRPAQQLAHFWLLSGCILIGLFPVLAVSAGPLGWWPFWLLLAPLSSLLLQRLLALSR